jgi:hypothetical protein
MVGVAFVQVTEDQLKKIPCPTCKKVGTLEFMADGSSAVPEGMSSDVEQSVTCSEGDFDGSEADPYIQAAAKKLSEQDRVVAAS